MSDTETKARSRIKHPTSTENKPTQKSGQQPTRLSGSSGSKGPKRSRRQVRSINWPSFSELSLSYSAIDATKYYLKQLPILLIGLLCYAALLYIFLNIHPNAIANWLFYHSYLPVVVTFALGNFFIFWYLLKEKRRGLIASTTLSLILILKLQAVIITWHIIGVFLLLSLIIEGFFLLILKR